VPIRVLVVDDAAGIRLMLGRTLARDPELQVVGAASNGRVGMEKIAELAPDVVVLDLAMPEMDGLEMLRLVHQTHRHLPVVMFSALTHRGTEMTMEALLAGASDYVPKPTQMSTPDDAATYVASELVPKIKALCAGAASALGARGRDQRGAALRPGASSRPATSVRAGVVALGVSTGGPQALAEIIPKLPKGFSVPMLIVQHMPSTFTALLAERLGSLSAIRVKEAAHGDLLQRGWAYVAPGDHHMALSVTSGEVRIKLHQGPHENSCRPSVDVLLRSVADVYGAAALAAILTGMGQDGLRGCHEIRARGGSIVVQDEGSSVVWGMPRAVAEAGLADAIIPLDRFPGELVRRVPKLEPARDP
jgi:two-component system chemotaxis response regulator CheB